MRHDRPVIDRVVRPSALALVAMALLALVGCGSSGSGAGDLTLEELVQQLRDGGIDCDGTPSAPSGDQASAFGITVSEEVECTVDGTTISIARFSDEASVAKALVFVEGFGCAFGGQDLSYLTAGPWLASASKDGGDGAPDADMIDRMSKAWGVKARTIDCPADSGAGDGSSGSSDTSGSSGSGSGSFGDDAIAVKGGTDPVAFGETLEWEDGITVTVGEPQPYEGDGLDDAKAYVQFDVSLVNGTDERFDPSSFSASVRSGTSEASRMYDTSVLGEEPSTTLLPGKEARWKIAFGVEDPADLVMEVAPTFGFDYEDGVYTTG